MAIFEQHSSEIGGSNLWLSFRGIGTAGALSEAGLWLQPGRSNFRGLGGGNSENGRAASFLPMILGIASMDPGPQQSFHYEQTESMF